jgi:hypothetical protein
VRKAYKVFIRNPEGKRLLGRPWIGGRIILKWIFVIQDERMWIGLD